MSVSVNKELISFQNCFSIILTFAEESVTKSFLISNVSVGHMFPASCELSEPALRHMQIPGTCSNNVMTDY